MTGGMCDLSDKVVWFVGGAGYLGSATCCKLADCGAHVVIADLDGKRAAALCEQIAARGLSCEAMQLDIGDEAAVVAAGEDIVSRLGRLDVAVNATYAKASKPMDQLTLEDWQQAMRVLLGGAFVFARQAARHMLPRRRGSIIQFSSMYGVVSPDPGIYPPEFPVNPVEYGVGKAGILQMVRYQAAMWGSRGVRVNAIVPGPFPIPDGQGANAGFVASLARKTMLGRIGSAEEIAGPVIFLASDASSYITGSTLTVDGGWCAW